jgi:hypothetical protein
MAKQTFTTGQVLSAAQVNALQANDYNTTVSTKTASYVLVAADVGTTIVQNVATANTVTVNTGLFAAGDTLRIQNIGAGVATVTAGTATVNTANSLALPQWGSGILYFTSASAAIFFPSAGAAAAGGGKVLQVIMGTTSTNVSNSTITLANTLLTATITPSSTGSKILVLVSQNGVLKTDGNLANAVLLKLFRAATEIAKFGSYVGYTNTALYNTVSSVSTGYLDSPSTTSATTYKTQFANEVSATAAVQVQANSALSTIILMEIGA